MLEEPSMIKGNADEVSGGNSKSIFGNSGQDTLVIKWQRI
jgi:hypothetical protein